MEQGHVVKGVFKMHCTTCVEEEPWAGIYLYYANWEHTSRHDHHYFHFTPSFTIFNHNCQHNHHHFNCSHMIPLSFTTYWWRPSAPTNPFITSGSERKRRQQIQILTFVLKRYFMQKLHLVVLQSEIWQIV